MPAVPVTAGRRCAATPSLTRNIAMPENPNTTGRTTRRLNRSSGIDESIKIIEPKTRLVRPPSVSNP